MADTKVTAMTALTAPTTDDLLAAVDDPTGTPVTKKLAISDLLTLFVSTVTVQTLTASSGTYTPTALMKKCLVIAVGGGAGGESVTAASETGGGGGGGGTVIRLFTAAEIAAHGTYAVGQAVSAATAGNPTTFSASPTLLTASGGGRGGVSGNTTTVGVQSAGGAGGTATGGDLNIPGENGQRGVMYSSSAAMSGSGGRSVFGSGGSEVPTNTVGNAGVAYGGGGGGAACSDGTDRAGGTGATGVIYVIEFLD